MKATLVIQIFKSLGISSTVIHETDNYDFEYLGRKKFNGRDTILVKSSYKKDKDIFKEGFAKTYIDTQTGVVVSNQAYIRIGIILKRVKDNMIVKFDCVTDEDVARPNLAGYVVKDFRDQEQ